MPFGLTGQVQWDEQNKVWYFIASKYNSYRTIDLYFETVELLKRGKERQDRAKIYYGEHYTHLFMNNKRQWNTTEDG